jgi:hypothetical protein
MLRRYRVVSVVAAGVIAAVGGKTGHVMKPFGFWDGPL